MALRDLSSQEMVMVSASWVDPGRDLPTLEGDPMLAGLALGLQRAHERLLTLKEQVGSARARVADLTEELGRLDDLHDRKGRGVWWTLMGAEEMADAAQQAEAYGRLRYKLFGDQGLQVVQLSYRAQAGAAKQVEESLDSQDRQVLGEISFGADTLLDHVDVWLETGKLIGRKVAERARLSGEEDDEEVRPMDLREARFGWIRATDAFMKVLELSDLDEDHKRRLLADLYEAEEVAARRARSDADDEPAADADPSADEPADADVDEPDVTEPA